MSHWELSSWWPQDSKPHPTSVYEMEWVWIFWAYNVTPLLSLLLTPLLWQVMVKGGILFPFVVFAREGNRKWRIAFMEYLQSPIPEEGLHTQPGKLYFLLSTEERTDVQECWVTCPRAQSQELQCQNSNPVDTSKAKILPREGTLVPFFFFLNFFGHTLLHVGS